MTNIDLKTLMWDKGLTQTDIADIMGVNQSVVSKFIRGQRCPLKHHIEKLEAHFGTEIIKYYSELKKTTEMVQPPISTSNTVGVSVVAGDEEIVVDIESLMQELEITASVLALIIGETEEYIYRCNGKFLPHHIIKLQERYGINAIDKHIKLSNVVEAEVIEVFPMLPEEVAIKPNTDLREYIEENSAELEQVNPGQLLKSANMAERILRTSMSPRFLPGDIVFVQFLEHESRITDGEMYYIKSRTRASMIRKVKFEENHKIRLVALNPQYADVIMDRCDIINVGTIVGMLRLTFGDQYSEIEEIRQKKDAQIEKRDTQMDKILEVIGKQTEQQGMLIEHLINKH